MRPGKAASASRVLLAASVPALATAELRAADAQLSSANAAAAYKAAGYAREGSHGHGGFDDRGAASYAPPAIETVRDLSGDGRPEAVIVEGSAYCYGNTGQGFQLVAQQPDSSWRLVFGGAGIPNFLPSHGADRWPDIEVRGPGVRFPVYRWNGRQYTQHRKQYEVNPDVASTCHVASLPGDSWVGRRPAR